MGGDGYTAEFWQYDARIGRRWNLDPVVKIHESPYATFLNNPVWFVDLFGLDGDTTINGKVHQQLPEVIVAAKAKPKTYSTGNVYRNSRDDDFTKTRHNNININTSLYDKYGSSYDPNAINNHSSRFKQMFSNGTILENANAQYEAGRLVTHFETGKGELLPPFSPTSEMSKILRQDAQFLEMVNQFEGQLMEYLKKTGSLKGFNENDILRTARAGKYIKGTWFMHTVLGGFQQVDAQIKIVTAGQIQIRYTIWDHFGAGTDDAASSLPGLPSLYWLQHESANNNILFSDWYTPYIWGIQVDRTIK